MLLADQDRLLWNRELIAEGVSLVERALSSRRFGPYSLQAALAAVHAEAPTPDVTDWPQIVGIYDVLVRADRSPVVELNRAAAVAMRDGPAAGLALIDAILARGELADYQFAHSARGELLRRLGRNEEARAAYERALTLTNQETERRFLRRRINGTKGQIPHFSAGHIRTAEQCRQIENESHRRHALTVPAEDSSRLTRKVALVEGADNNRFLEVHLKESPPRVIHLWQGQKRLKGDSRKRHSRPNPCGPLIRFGIPACEPYGSCSSADFHQIVNPDGRPNLAKNDVHWMEA